MMLVKPASHIVARLAAAFLTAGSAAMPSLASAQAWILEGGVTARGEYNDNYFLAPAAKESAFTGTVAPFVSVARKTENSAVTGLLALGANKVWGLPDSEDYLSVNFGLKGSFRDERSTWIGNASFVRTPSLQEVSLPTGIVLALANTNTAAVDGGYTFALTERWSVGATAGWISNTYDDVAGGVSANALADNNQYNLGASLGYGFSERTQLLLSAVVSRYTSDISRSDSFATTISLAHQYSPDLSVSASLGGYWSDTRSLQLASITGSDKRDDSGALYGGGVSYAFSERTKFLASLSESLSPSSTGTVTRTDAVTASISHLFSERLTGRFGASYTRTKTPTGIAAESTTDYYGGEAGVSYLLAERWSLDAAYRYTRAEYSQNPFEPESNVIFVSVTYNPPETSLTGWMGTPPDTRSSPGAGPVSLPEY